MLFSYLANDISIVGSRANEAGQTEGDRRIVFQMLFSYFANDIFLLCKRYCPTSQMILSSKGAAQMDRAERRETEELFSKCYFSTLQTIFSYFANDINIEGSRANGPGQTEGDRRIVFQMLFFYCANDIFLLCK